MSYWVTACEFKSVNDTISKSPTRRKSTPCAQARLQFQDSICTVRFDHGILSIWPEIWQVPTAAAKATILDGETTSLSPLIQILSTNPHHISYMWRQYTIDDHSSCDRSHSAIVGWQQAMSYLTTHTLSHNNMAVQFIRKAPQHIS